MTGAAKKRRNKRNASQQRVGVLGLGAEFMREMMKPPGQEDYQAAYRRVIRATRWRQK